MGDAAVVLSVRTVAGGGGGIRGTEGEGGTPGLTSGRHTKPNYFDPTGISSLPTARSRNILGIS